MKIAISGKGGVGKSTLAAALALIIARDGRRILALDADPDANLAASLGLSAKQISLICPVSQQIALIEERTGAKVKQYGQMFKINPDVSDVSDKYATVHNGVALLVLGAVKKGGGGCACPENVFIRALVSDLVLNNNDALIMDMEAGIEHLGRATTSGVDAMIVVVEPGQRSIDCAHRVVQMAGDIGVTHVYFVANKVASQSDEQFIKSQLNNSRLLGVIPYTDEIRNADRDGKSVLDGLSPQMLIRFEEILKRLEQGAK